MSTELGLDSSDPLSLALHNNLQSDDSSNDESPQSENPVSQDWSKFSPLWSDHPQAALKQYTDAMDFSDLSSLPMDMDFDPMCLEFDPLSMGQAGITFPYDDQFSDMLCAPFNFAFQPSNASNFSASSSESPQSFSKERRLSVTSSSSSSGASLSPVPESLSSPAPGYISDTVQPKEEPVQSNEVLNPYANDPAAELAHRVRQAAGVMLAVPMQGFGTNFQMGNPSQTKLTIAKLPRNNSVSSPRSSNASSSSSAASTPPPSTPPSSSGSPLNLTANTCVSDAAFSVSTPTTTTAPSTALPRPKTSHTTIERRYRTNLNARIQSLRMAVPALRVLEDREGGNGKKIKKNVKGGIIVKGAGIGIVDSEDGTVVDVIDERGFVDGVKVARKCSKANVLGKAVEYIRVLKKREQRLKAEQAGLKTLIAGLVGGPALVREWEKEWRAKFGGEEKDEVEGEDEEGDDEDSDDEDGEDGDEETGKKRKRPKVSSSGPKKAAEKEKKPAPPVVLLTGEQVSNPPEKRKRGRPRKILSPPVTLAPVAPSARQDDSKPIVQDEAMQPPPFSATQPQWAQQQQSQPQQFLLAVFALFSFFNSPLTSSSSSTGHHHTGTVLTSVHPPLAYAPEIISQFIAPVSSPSAPVGWAWKEYVQLFHLLVSLLILASFFGNWLGISFTLGVGKVVARGRSMSVRPFRRTRSAANEKTCQGGSTGWLGMAEEAVLEGEAASFSYFERFQIYRSICTKKNVSTNDLATLAMVLANNAGVAGSLARMKARSIWSAAKHQAEKVQSKYSTAKISEMLAFQSMDVGDASRRLARATAKERSDGDNKIYTPLEVLGCLVVKDRVKEHLGSLFIEAVALQDDFEEDATSQEKAEQEQEEWRKTIEAARELGGHVEELGKMLERVWKASTSAAVEDSDLVLDTDAEFEADVDGEIKALLTALVLYRRLFADVDAVYTTECMSSSTSTLLMSPQPSPRPRSPASKANVKQAKMMLSLRKALGHQVFEDAAATVEERVEQSLLGLEDARDHVVDMIVEVERRERGASPSS